MAQNIDEVYSDLVRDERFKSLYPTQSDFVQYLENEPSADTDIEELFGVKSASEYLKKKTSRSSKTSEKKILLLNLLWLDRLSQFPKKLKQWWNSPNRVVTKTWEV